MQAFMAMTIHFLTEDFTMRNYTLEVCPVLGKHTADMIRGEMGMALTNWNLKKENITMMLCDSGSNMVKACRDWGINHFASIGHSLHLVIGPFLVNKKKKRSTDNEAEYEEELGENEAEDTDYFVDDFNEDLEQDECVAYVREVVHEIRNICKYIKNSTKTKEKFEHLQKQLDMENILAVKLDVRTRWNSTYHMLEQVIKVIEPLRQFLAYFASPLGHQEFKGTKALPDISYEKWALIQGLCYLVRIFDKATKILSGEEYSTFVAALPVLF